jgi:hypothetical protein
MRDLFDYGSPLMWLGRCADFFFLRSYMAGLLGPRAMVIKQEAERRAAKD